MEETTAQELEDIEALFVQSAAGFSADDGTVTLHGLSPSTVYFSDRPKREVGHIASRAFVDLWGDGENSFAVDPPNAVLSYLEPGSTPPEDTVVVISDPHLEGDELTYTVKVLEGTLPGKASACSLFIDPFGRPLSPVSVAGVHRRERRRRR